MTSLEPIHLGYVGSVLEENFQDLYVPSEGEQLLAEQKAKELAEKRAIAEAKRKAEEEERRRLEEEEAAAKGKKGGKAPPPKAAEEAPPAEEEPEVIEEPEPEPEPLDDELQTLADEREVATDYTARLAQYLKKAQEANTEDYVAERKFFEGFGLPVHRSHVKVDRSLLKENALFDAKEIMEKTRQQIDKRFAQLPPSQTLETVPPYLRTTFSNQTHLAHAKKKEPMPPSTCKRGKFSRTAHAMRGDTNEELQGSFKDTFTLAKDSEKPEDEAGRTEAWSEGTKTGAGNGGSGQQELATQRTAGAMMDTVGADAKKTVTINPEVQVTSFDLDGCAANGLTMEAAQYLLSQQSEMAVAEQEKAISKRKTKPKVLAEQKEMFERFFDRMNRPLRFMRNPRYAGKQGMPYNIRDNESGFIPSDSVESQGALFTPYPNVMKFVDYEVGGVYELPLHLRNVTNISRRVRVLPPTSPYFSVTLTKYPSGDGTVAPGMSCQVMVRFMPDSLADFDDEVVVLTEDNRFSVRVTARRDPPILTLPQTLDCGHCLVDGIKTTVFKVKNTGGHGRFRMFNALEWPTPRLDEVDMVVVPPFKVGPAQFQLDHNETTEITVEFTPEEVGEQRGKFVLVCDNCQVKTFEMVATGVKPQFEIVFLEGEELDPSVTGPLETVTFDELSLGATRSKTVTVHNLTPLPLKFHWNLYKFDFKRKSDNALPGAGGTRSTAEGPQPIDMSDDNMPFVIHPASGVFEGGSNMDFTVTFRPKEVKPTINDALFFVEDIPYRPKLDYDPIDQGREYIEDVLLKFKIQGSGANFHVTVDPPVLVLPGLSMLNKTYRRTFHMLNTCESSTKFKWIGVEEQSKGAVFIRPNEGTLPAQKKKEFEIIFRSSKLGRFEYDFNCWIADGHPASVHLKANVDGPRILLDAPLIDFGLVEAGSQATFNLTFSNKSDVAGEWIFCEQGTKEVSFPKKTLKLRKLGGNPGLEHIHNAVRDSEFNVVPIYGTLAAHSSDVVTVIFKPRAPRHVKTILECRVNNGATQYIQVIAEVQAPKICLLQTELDGGETFTGLEKAYKLTMRNLSFFPAYFHWKDFQFEMEMQEEPGSRYQLAFKPERGAVEPGQDFDIEVTYVGYKVGKVDAIMCCDIERMELPLGCTLHTETLGLRVSYHLRHNPYDPEAPEGYKTKAEIEEETRVREAAERQAAILASASAAATIAEEPEGEQENEQPAEAEGEGENAEAENEKGAEPVKTEEEEQPEGEEAEGDQQEGEEAQDADAANEKTAEATPKSQGSAVDDTPDSLWEKREMVDRETPRSEVEVKEEYGLKLNFGNEFPMFEERSLKFIIRNDSPIPSSFQVDIETFGSIDPDEYEKTKEEDRKEKMSRVSAASSQKSRRTMSRAHRSSASVTSRTTRKKPLLTDKHEKVKPFVCEEGQELIAQRMYDRKKRQILRDERGIAFVVSPPMGPLDSWEEVEVTVTCYCDMFGEYKDNVIVQVHGLENQIIPINVRAVGTPLILHPSTVGLTVMTDPPSIQYGAMMSEAPPLTKIVKVNNNGPLDMDVDWKIYKRRESLAVFKVDLRVGSSGKIRCNIAERDPVEEEDTPFTIEPRSQRVPGRGSATFQVTFQSDNPGLYNYYALSDARISDKYLLSDEPIMSTGKQSAAHKDRKRPYIHWNQTPMQIYDMKPGIRERHPYANTAFVLPSPLMVELFATTVSPSLDADHKEELHFHVSKSVPANHPSFLRTVNLNNNTHAYLTLAISAEGPFQIVKTTTSAPPHPLASKLQATLTASGTLTKRNNVNTVFTLPPNYNVLTTIKLAIPSNLPNEVNNHLTGNIVVTFANNVVQRIPIEATVVRPQIFVEPPKLDFQDVNVETVRTLTLKLSNYTSADAHWRVEHVKTLDYKGMHTTANFLRFTGLRQVETPRHPEDVETAFEFSQVSGVIPGRDGGTLPAGVSTCGIPSRQTIEVAFKPTKDLSYESKFRFVVEGGKGMDVTFFGRGRYEEEYDEVEKRRFGYRDRDFLQYEEYDNRIATTLYKTDDFRDTGTYTRAREDLLRSQAREQAAAKKEAEQQQQQEEE